MTRRCDNFEVMVLQPTETASKRANSVKTTNKSSASFKHGEFKLNMACLNDTIIPARVKLVANPV